MWKKWKQWIAKFTELLLGPTLEDIEENYTDEQIENWTEEADDYGIYSDYYERKRGSVEVKSGNDH